MKTLIIVESPNKAQKIANYAKPVLGGTVFAWACHGHLRDLPEGELGIEIENGFKPQYRIMKNRTRTIADLREKISQADRVILATDPDREGEAVAWHLYQIFKRELQGKEFTRAVFNSITEQAVQSGMKRLRPIDKNLVQAAVARRVMDRLVGYMISPKLWKWLKGKDLSAGRVQTSALHLIVEHEQTAFDKWSVDIEIDL